MKFFKNNYQFILGLFAIIIANLFFFNQASARQADIDPGFDIGTGFNNSVRSIKIQDDGKILVGGEFTSYNGIISNRIIRLNPDGSRDTEFNIGNGFNNSVRSIEIQNDGKIIVGGNFSTYSGTSASRIIRLNPDGSRDPSFMAGSFDYMIYCVKIQKDGKIVVGGQFNLYNGSHALRIIRLNPDGSRDIGFGKEGAFGFQYIVSSIAIQNDDKIIAGGYFSSYRGINANNIIRLNSDGSRDNSLNIGTAFNNDVESIAIQNDGKIIVGGIFGSYNGIVSRSIIRLNPDGSRDAEFNIGNGFNNSVLSITIQNDDKIIVGGGFTTYKGLIVNRIVRLNSNGSRDTAFDIGNGFNGNVFSLAIQNDGKIIVGGGFTTYKNQPAGYLIALKGNNPLIIPASTDTNETINRFTYRGYTLSGGILSGSTPFSLSESNGVITANLNIKNQNNRLNLSQNLQFKKYDNSNYTGTISPPTTYTGITTVESKPVLSAISVGSTTESLSLTNGAATLGIPVAGSNIGDPVSIYSSQDGSNWTYEKGGIVSEIDGQPYISFTTDHFTYFAIAGSTGSFVINNDDASTTSQNVTLTISAPTATGMRFSNVSGSDRSEWEPISSTKSWELSSGYEEKTVYAQFIANGEIYSTSDSIIYGIIGDGTQGNISLTITGGTTECVYGTSLYLGAQDVTIDPSGYTFSGDFSPSSWYCADFKGFDGWAFSIHTSDLSNEKSNIISGSNVLISHNPPVVQGHDSCTGHNGSPATFNNGTGLVLMEKSNVPENNKICRVDISNVKLEVNVPPYQAPGNYSGTLTITIPNGFNE